MNQDNGLLNKIRDAFGFKPPTKHNSPENTLKKQDNGKMVFKIPDLPEDYRLAGGLEITDENKILLRINTLPNQQEIKNTCDLLGDYGTVFELDEISCKHQRGRGNSGEGKLTFEFRDGPHTPSPNKPGKKKDNATQMPEHDKPKPAITEKKTCEEEANTLIDEQLVAELAGELGIDNKELINEILEELTQAPGELKNPLKDVEKMSELLKIEETFSKKSAETQTPPPLMEYKPAKFQKITITPHETELIYETSEPQLNEKEKTRLRFIKNVFDKLIGMEDIVVSEEPGPKKKYLEEKFSEILNLYNIKFRDEPEKERIFYFIQRDFLKYGKLDVVMNDRYIEDISCNGPKQPVYVYHRNYGSIKTDLTFKERELNEYILQLSQLCGKHTSILNPITDASLPDGSRINMTLGSEVTRKGSTFTIRKFKKVPMSPVELMDSGSVNSRLLAYIWLLQDYGKSILVSGGTASGKTTLLNAISMFIKPQLKIVSIEDTPEINIEHPNWLQSVARTGFGQQQAGGGVSGISGLSGISPTKTKGDIGLYDLLVAALRQRPDYILVGEVRGSEAFTMFQAIAVGHSCMGTIHARNMRELVGRVESVPMNVPRTLFSNIDLVVFISQIKTGNETVRRIMEVVEVLELEPETKGLITNTISRWDGRDDSFKPAGRLMLFDQITKEFGIPAESLIKEHEKRTGFLDELKKNKITNHVEVTKKVVGYYDEINKFRKPMPQTQGEPK